MAKTKPTDDIEMESTDLPENTEIQEEPDTAKSDDLLLQQLEDTKNELASAKESLLRVAAEYDNYRKRTAKELEARYGDAKAMTVSALLPAVDNLERALAQENVSFEDIQKGIELTLRQFGDTFASLGVEPVGQEGETFDPNLHNAVLHCEDESLPENVIAQVLQKGYKCGERVIRHAMVKVAN